MAEGLSHEQIQLLFLQMGVLLLVARLLGEAMKKADQPPVLGELLAGIVLGPSLLGWTAPGVFAALFPSDVAWSAGLETVSWLGLALLMLVIGLETDIHLLRSLGRPTFMVSLFGLVVPFGAGLGLGYLLPERFIPATASRLTTSLFLATALSVSAMPVIAKVLADLGLLRRNVGLVTLTAAIANDTIGWIALALISGLVSLGRFQTHFLFEILLLLALFLLVARFVLYPLVRWILRKGSGLGAFPGRDYVIVAVLAFFCAAATHAIGVHAVFGAFVAGVILRQCPSLSAETLHRIEGITMAVFAPLFFAGVGLKVDFTQVQGFFWPALVIVIAILGKVVGCTAGGLFGRMTFTESLAVGFGMNARGAVGLVVAVVGASLEVIGQELFATVVLVAMVTTLIAPLSIRSLARYLPVSKEEEERERPPDRGFLPKGRLKILIPTAGGPNALLACHIAAVLSGHEGDSATAIYVDTERRPPWERPASWRRRPKLDVEQLFAELRSSSREPRGLLLTRTVASEKGVRETILEEVRRGYDFLFLGASGQSNPVYDPFISGIVRANPCHVIVVRGPRSGTASAPFKRILVPTNGSDRAHAAFDLVADYAARVDAHVTVLYMVESEERNPLLPSSGLDSSHGRARDAMLETLRTEFSGRIREQLLTCKIMEGSSVAAVVSEEVKAGAYDCVALGAENKSIVDGVYFGHNIEAGLEQLDCAVAIVIPKAAAR